VENLFANLQNLVAKFEADRAHYLCKDYPEAQAKIDFITPFFKALGWDVENVAGLPHHQREVTVERGETEGRPNYNFRLDGRGASCAIRWAGRPTSGAKRPSNR
jgi:predicted type IV restriction endonuclease